MSDRTLHRALLILTFVGLGIAGYLGATPAAMWIDGNGGGRDPPRRRARRDIRHALARVRYRLA